MRDPRIPEQFTKARYGIVKEYLWLQDHGVQGSISRKSSIVASVLGYSLNKKGLSSFVTETIKEYLTKKD